jgi:hypothetical protein
LPDIAEHLDGTDAGQSQRLAGDILVARRYPRIAQDIAHNVSQTTVLWTAAM